jgi:hypothetical protein
MMAAGPKTTPAARAAVALMLVAALVGCGKKGPPRPPGRPALPAVGDLSLRIEARRAIFQWTVPTAAAVSAQVAGFYVQAAPYGPPDKACPDCPPVFKRIGEVIFQPGAEPIQSMGFAIPIEPGRDTLYKITTYARDGEQVDSNMVRARGEN